MGLAIALPGLLSRHGAGNPARALGPMLVTGVLPVGFFYTIGPLLRGVVAALAFRLIGRASAKKAGAK